MESARTIGPWENTRLCRVAVEVCHLREPLIGIFSVWLRHDRHPAGVKTRNPFVRFFGTTEVMPCYKTLPIKIEVL